MLDVIAVAIKQYARRLSVANIHQGLYSMGAIMMIVLSGDRDVFHLMFSTRKFSLFDSCAFFFLHFGRTSVIAYEWWDMSRQ
jgi:hypothetical protein